MRTGIRVQDLQDLKIFRTKLEESLKINNAIIEKVYGLKPLDPDEIFTRYSEYVKRIGKYIADTTFLINRALEENKRVLFEGAQGAMLDIDHGTYPFVTSSSTTRGGVFTGSGYNGAAGLRVLGITKAYTTRLRFRDAKHPKSR